MFELVPSEFMRMIFKDRGFELTDFNKATLIWNRDDKSRAEKLQRCRNCRTQRTTHC